MNQKHEKIIKTWAIIAMILLFCTAFIAIDEWRAYRYREDFKAKAVPVALERAEMECLKEALAEDQCKSLVAVPMSEPSECGRPRSCWLVYVRSTDDEIFSSVMVAKEGDEMVVVSYLRNKLGATPQ